MGRFYFCKDSDEYIKVDKNTKYGFICIEFSYDMAEYVSFNSAKEYAKEWSTNEDEFDDLEKLEVGESVYLGDFLHVRIW